MVDVVKFIPASEKDYETVRITPCIYTVDLQCLICDEVIRKEYVGGSITIPPTIYICEDCKDTVKRLKQVKTVYCDEGNEPQIAE